MAKNFSSLSLVYRFLIITIVSVNFYRIEDTTLTKENLIMYSVFFLYALGISLMKENRYVGYIELIVIVGLIHFYPFNWLYFLFILPMVNIASERLKWYETILIPLALSGYYYIVNKNVMISALIVMIGFMVLNVFNNKFKKIKILEQSYSRLEKEKEEVKNELMEHMRELDIITNMFEDSKRIIKIIEFEDLISEMVDAPKGFFNASYVSLHIKEGGRYHLIREKGQRQKFNVSKVISKEEVVASVRSNIMQVPIKYESKDWGMLTVCEKHSDIGEMKRKVFYPFRHEDFEIINVYIEQAMMKMKHTVLLKKYHNLATIDELTQVPNRRYFYKQLLYLVERARRGDTLTVIHVDIDHFKRFNDTYGHQTGDEALKIVAKELENSVRKMDIVGRLGGEEFSILLPNTKGHDYEIAERIRKNIENLEFVETITVSVGVAMYENGMEYDELMNKADKALYMSKNNGRNQVTVYKGDDEK